MGDAFSDSQHWRGMCWKTLFKLALLPRYPNVTKNRTLSDLSVISVTVGYLDVVWMCSDIY